MSKMFNLIAVAYEDGYAFVKKDGKIYSIRPPYNNTILASLENVERAISTHGFSNEQLDFDNWATLISYLKTQFIERRKQAGQNEPNTDRIRRLMQRAPRNKVQDFLTRIEKELIPNREWKAVLSLLTNLLKNKIVKEDDALLTRCAELLEECQSAKNRIEEEVFTDYSNEESLKEEFQLAFDYYGEKVGEITNMIRNQKQILIVGSANI